MKYLLISILVSYYSTSYEKSMNACFKTYADSSNFQLRLTKVELTPDCGFIALTTAQKFEVLNEGQSFLPKKYVIVLQRCPELLGKGFFVQGSFYYANLSLATDDTGAVNNYRKENLPTYWCNVIRRGVH
jgi:hypothetical protein